MGRGGGELAAIKAGPLAGVTGGAGGFDEREQGVAVTVDAQRAHGLTLPLVSPFSHCSSRERLHRCSWPLARVSSRARSFM